MAIEKKQFLYEVLARFDENGFVGAHQVLMQQVVDADGTVYSTEALPAQPLAKEDVASLLGQQFLAMTEQVNAAVAARDALGAENVKLLQQVAALSGSQAELGRQLSEARDELVRLQEAQSAVAA